MSTKNKTKNGLTMKHMIGYGAGDFGGCMTFAIMGSFLTRYYVNVALIDTVMLAGLTMIWKIWDAINDPMMGALMDKMFAKNKNPKGKFRPWMLRSTPLLAITAILMFTAPTMVDGTARLVVVFVTYLLYEGCYTIFNIPYGSLLSAMSNNDEERAALSSARGIGSTIGNIIPLVLFPILISVFESNPELGYAGGVTACAIVGFVLCFLSYAWTEERNIIGTETKAEDIKFTDILEVIKKNRAFLALCLHGLFICTMQYISTSLGTYMYSDVLGDIALMSMATMLALPLSLIFMAAAPKVSAKMGLENMIRASLLVSIGLYIVLFVMHLVSNVNIWVHIVLSTMAASFTELSILMQWGLVGEAIDYNEYLTGKRTEGSIYGTFNMMRRLGQAVGSSLGVLLLGMIGYDAELANAGGTQADGVIIGIKVLVVLLPAIFALGSWASFKFLWNITPEIREKIVAVKASKTSI